MYNYVEYSLIKLFVSAFWVPLHSNISNLWIFPSEIRICIGLRNPILIGLQLFQTGSIWACLFLRLANLLTRFPPLSSSLVWNKTAEGLFHTANAIYIINMAVVAQPTLYNYTWKPCNFDLIFCFSNSVTSVHDYRWKTASFNKLVFVNVHCPC